MENWNTNNPKEKGEYICRMNNAYIKMCHWTGERWLDMWVDSLDGKVKEWIVIPYDELKEANERIKKLEETIEMISPLFEYSEPSVYRNVLKLINREDLI